VNLTMTTLYETDYLAWTQQQADLLRSGRLAALDIEHLAEEIESMGRSELHQLESRLSVLLMHLLKWKYQPARRSRSWVDTISHQRRRIRKLLNKVPSLQPKLSEIFDDAYEDARVDAGNETGLGKMGFPECCPWTVEDVLADRLLDE